MPNEDSKPNERHADLIAVADLMKDIKKAVFHYLIPLVGLAVTVLVSGYFGQQRLTEKVAEMQQTFQRSQDKQEGYNEKTTVMWHEGGWAKEDMKTRKQ